MTTINAYFSGNTSDLEMVLFSGIKHYSSKAIRNNKMVVSWTCEEPTYEIALESIINDVCLRTVELWNCDLTYLG